jgi:hypothetical protein
MKYFVFLYSVLIISCSGEKSIISDYISEGFDITSLKGSIIRLYVNPVIDIREYKLIFESEYPSNALFNSLLTDKIKNELSKYSTVHIDKNVTLDSLLLNQSNTTIVKGIFEQVRENYFLGIKKVVLSNSITQGPQMQVSSSVGNTRGRSAPESNRTVEGKRKETCVIQITAEVWSVKEKRKVAEFTSKGQSPVFLLSYGVALKNALEYSVTHLSNYIEEKEE